MEQDHGTNNESEPEPQSELTPMERAVIRMHENHLESTSVMQQNYYNITTAHLETFNNSLSTFNNSVSNILHHYIADQ